MEKETDQLSPEPQKTKSQARFSYIGFVSFLLALAVMGFIFLQQKEITKTLTLVEQQTAKLESLEKQISGFGAQTQDQVDRWKKSIDKRIEASQKVLTQDQQTHATFYWIYLAQQYLEFLQRKDLALKALKQAEISAKNNPGVAMAINKAALSLGSVDIESTRQALQKLLALSDQVAVLSVAKKLPSEVIHATPEKESASTGYWGQFKEKTLDVLNRVLVIRHEGKEAVPPQTLEAHYLKSQLQLLLLQAQWAVVQQNKALYMDNIEKAKMLIKRYFASSDQAREMVRSLQQLKWLPMEESPNLLPLLKLVAPNKAVAILEEKEGVSE